MVKLTLASLLTLAFLITFSSIIIGQAEQDLVGYWPFDEGSGKETADVSGNGHDGGFVGDPDWVEGKFGKALRFDGQSSYVLIPHDEGISPTEEITLAAWFKPGVTINPANNDYRLMSKNNDIFLLFNYEQLGNLGFLIKDSGGTNHVVHSTTNEWAADEWYHVAGTYDGKELKIYINGELEATAAYAGAAGSSGLDMWVGADDLPAYFDGAVDEVRLYGAVLNDAEIKRIMDEPAAVRPEDKLPATWGETKTAN
jgi:hypothetical protein